MMLGGEDLDGSLVACLELTISFIRHSQDCYSIALHSNRPEDLCINHGAQTTLCPFSRMAVNSSFYGSIPRFYPNFRQIGCSDPLPRTD